MLRGGSPHIFRQNNLEFETEGVVNLQYSEKFQLIYYQIKSMWIESMCYWSCSYKSSYLVLSLGYRSFISVTLWGSIPFFFLIYWWVVLLRVREKKSMWTGELPPFKKMEQNTACDRHGFFISFSSSVSSMDLGDRNFR